MTTHNFIDVLESFPIELWKDIPTWDGAGLYVYSDPYRYKGGQLSNYQFFGCLKKNYKSQEAFDYVKTRLKDFHPLQMPLGDSIVFEPKRADYKFAKGTMYYEIDTLTFSVKHHQVIETIVTVPNTWARFNQYCNYWISLARKIWDTTRKNKIQEHYESTISDEEKLIRSVKNSQNIIEIGSKLHKIEAELELLRSKIAIDEIRKSDTQHFSNQIHKILAEIRSSAKNLPK